MAITSSGIGSGLDIESIVSQLVAAEAKGPTQRFDRKQAGLEQDLSGFGTLKSALADFQDSVQALQDPAGFVESIASSSNRDVFTADADEDAVPGSFNIQVEQLAQGSRVRTADAFDTDEVIGTGTVTVNLGTESSFEIAVDDTNNTLAGIRDAINNAEDNPGVSAAIINVDGGSRLVLSSDKGGDGNDITVNTVDDDTGDGADLTRLETLSTTQLAQSAQIFVDGEEVTSDSNTITGVIDGVTLNLKDATPGEVETLTVSRDTGATRNRVEGFVEAYNALNQLMNQLSAYDPETGKSGPLQGDSALRSVENQIRKTMTGAVSGVEFSSLSEIGITTNRDTGGLQIDNVRLDDALSEDSTAIADLFASENGIANQMDTLLERYTRDDGILDNRTSSLQSRIDSIDTDRERLDRRLEQIEARYRSEFAALDSLVGQLQGVGNFISQQLANIPVPGNN